MDGERQPHTEQVRAMLLNQKYERRAIDQVMREINYNFGNWTEFYVYTIPKMIERLREISK